MKRSLIAELFATSWLFAQGAGQRAASPMSVCELVMHRLEYNGKIVTVRGEVKASQHGIWLESECASSLVTKGVTWPNAVFLRYPSTKSRIEADRADFSIDWGAEEKITAQIDRLGFDPTSDQLFETVTGLFRTYPDLQDRVSPNIQIAPRGGFGPDGYFPAQLIIKTRLAPEVIHGKPGKE